MKWIIFGSLFWLIETAWFGWNDLPSCRAERWCDGIASAMVWFGIIKIVVKYKIKQLHAENERIKSLAQKLCSCFPKEIKGKE